LSQTELQVGDPAAAAQVVASSRALATTSDGQLLLSRAHLALGDLPAARADRRRARQLVGAQPTGKRAEAVLELGRLALVLGDMAAAREELATAARETPRDEAALYYAGVAYSATGVAADTAKAIEYFKAATRADPHAARAGVELGRLLYEK